MATTSINLTLFTYVVDKGVIDEFLKGNNFHKNTLTFSLPLISLSLEGATWGLPTVDA